MWCLPSRFTRTIKTGERASTHARPDPVEPAEWMYFPCSNFPRNEGGEDHSRPASVLGITVDGLAV